FMPISMSIAADEIGVPYLHYATDFRQQAGGQLAFAEAFGADLVSVISDPAVEAADLGAAIIAPEDQPASLDDLHSLLMEKSALAQLTLPAGGSGRRMTNRLAAVEALASAGSDLLVEGWVEGPCAEAADLRGLSRFMMDLYDDPSFARELLDFVTEFEIAFARAQIAAGAGIIGVGDAASSLIGPELFGEFILERHRRYVAAIHEAGALARLHICGKSGPLLSMTAQLGYDIIDLDSMVEIAEARSAAGPAQVFNGNLDPVRVVRDGNPASIVAALGACSAAAGGAWIVGAGCEIPRGTARANILAMRDFARSGQLP
ncbi:MAG: uroporphyrinogen decarboxylase family protein, partial [Spirochaetota bacterium]